MKSSLLLQDRGINSKTLSLQSVQAKLLMLDSCQQSLASFSLHKRTRSPLSRKHQLGQVEKLLFLVPTPFCFIVLHSFHRISRCTKPGRKYPLEGEIQIGFAPWTPIKVLINTNFYNVCSIYAYPACSTMPPNLADLPTSLQTNYK